MRRIFIFISVLTLFLTACGDASTTTTSASGTTTSTSNSSTTTSDTTSTTDATSTTDTTGGAPTSTTEDVEVPRIKVEDGVKTDGLDIISVRVGETVRFEVETDVTDEVHVHGFDLSFATIPGEGILVEFVADATGIFEVEIEGLELHIVDIEVTP